MTGIDILDKNAKKWPIGIGLPTNPMKIPGNWREGYVLDFHTIQSEFLEQGVQHDNCIYRRLPKNNET